MTIIDTTKQPKLELETQEAIPKPEGYIACRCCGHVLGYKAHIGKVLFFFIYSYPAAHCFADMASRRVNARMLDGDVYCPDCCSWQEWQPGRTWEKRR